MGSTHVSPAEMRKFAELYKELGTYAAVARATGRSASSVQRHLAKGQALLVAAELEKGKKKKKK